MRKDYKKLITPIVVLLVLITDQISKNFAQRYLKISCNKGSALGLGGDTTLLALIVVMIVYWTLRKEKRFLPNFGFALIFAGGLSNVIDRLVFGCVRDFISIANFPSFNLADTAITVGALIIFLDIFKRRK